MAPDTKDRLLKDVILPVALSAAVGFGSGFVGVKVALAEHAAALQYLDRELTETRRDLSCHEKLDGHPASLERLKALDARLSDLQRDTNRRTR